MRVAWILALAGCTPEIVSGAYLCGAEQACPPGLVCNGADNTCVSLGAAEPFACDPSVEHEPDNDIAHAVPVANLGCVSPVHSLDGCLAANDPADWFGFDAPAACTAVEANIRLTFPIAWEPLVVSLADNTGTVVGTDDVCPDAAPTSATGESVRCLKVALVTGSHYGASIAPVGGGDCDGDCAFNRYTVSLALDTP